ncbi:hypothetical protein KM043_002327 [Ampulex compressa]|nr:hypothetical protein KM043_002327 [Ampulex compressa]
MADSRKWQSIVDKTVINLTNAFERLHEIWEEIGFNEEGQDTYCMQAHNHIQELLHDMIRESEHRKEALVQDTKRLMENVASLCKELKTDIVTTGYEYIPLYELEGTLQKDLQNLLHLKEQRITYRKQLLEKEHIICKSLGIKPLGISTNLPSEEVLNSFKLYLEKQEEEKSRLETIFKDMRRSIVKMIDELEIVPELNFEEIVYSKPESFVFTSNNMTKLREFRDRLLQQVEEAKEQVAEMRENLIILWNHLEEPEHIRQTFLDSHSGISSTTITAMRAEIMRCNEKRKENIAKYIAKIRNELLDLWSLCKCKELKLKEFTAYHSDTFNEDLFALHELEVERVRKYYNDNKHIFDLLEEYENLWLKMNELEHRANDPDRFYNRGGQLLIEEKERKTLRKKLPKVADELRVLVEQYERTHGDAFLVRGVSLEIYLTSLRNLLNVEKGTTKKSKKEVKDKSLKKTPTTLSAKKAISSSMQRHTPLAISKRKLPLTASPNTSSKRRNAQGLKNRPTAIGSKIRRSGKMPKRIIPSNRTPKGGKQRKESPSAGTADTTYLQFQQHLTDRDELCSSMIPKGILHESTMCNVETPVRTPAKPLRRNLPTIVTSNATPELSRSTNKTPRSASALSLTPKHKLSVSKGPRSPRIIRTPKLVTVPSATPIIL